MKIKVDVSSPECDSYGRPIFYSMTWPNENCLKTAFTDLGSKFANTPSGTKISIEITKP